MLGWSQRRSKGIVHGPGTWGSGNSGYLLGNLLGKARMRIFACSFMPAMHHSTVRSCNTLISGHPGGLTPVNPRAFAPRHCQIPPTQGQYSSTKNYHCPFLRKHNLKKIGLEHGLLLRRHHSSSLCWGWMTNKRGQIYQTNARHAYIFLCCHFGSRSMRSGSFIFKMVEMLQIPQVFSLVSCLESAKAVQYLHPEPKMGNKSQQIPRYSPVCPHGQPPGMAADMCITSIRKMME